MKCFEVFLASPAGGCNFFRLSLSAAVLPTSLISIKHKVVFNLSHAVVCVRFDGFTNRLSSIYSLMSSADELDAHVAQSSH